MITDPTNLKQFRWIVINTSAGKDSQTMMGYVVDLAKEQGFPLERIRAVHADLGKEEWKLTKELAKQQADAYGIELIIVKRRRADGSGDSILEYTKRRGKWPSSKQRWCTSDFKRAPVGRVFTQLYRGPILNCLGMRADESPARSKMLPFEENKRFSNDSRAVYNWLPIHRWTLGQVWSDIKRRGIPHHYAYDLGMPRLSCCFCIFAPPSALLLAGKHNPELLAEYVETEQVTGHSFRDGFTIKSIQDRLNAGEQPAPVADWKM